MVYYHTPDLDEHTLETKFAELRRNRANVKLIHTAPSEKILDIENDSPPLVAISGKDGSGKILSF